MILLKSLKVKIKGSKILKTRAREGGASVFTSFLFSKAAATAKREIQRAGKKEGGLGEGIFARLPKRSPAALLVQSRVPQKSFLFLLEEKEIARQIKIREENFFAEQRARRAAAGRSVSRFVQNRFELRSVIATTYHFSP